MSAEVGGLREALGEFLGSHLFLEGWTNPVEFAASDNARCTCGHNYGNPNASAGYSHPLHLADALLAPTGPIAEALREAGARGRGGLSEPQTEWGVEVAWNDPKQAGASEPTTLYGPFRDRGHVSRFLGLQEGDWHSDSFRVLTRTAAYTLWVADESGADQ